MLRGKKILLGISGSIAAYKAALLVRLLVKNEAEVQVVMTASATSFISPLTLSTLSKRPVFTDFENPYQKGTWVNHIDLALWADLVVVAPASANTIAKFSNGLCDNLLSAVYLSARSKVMIAPAMDADMYDHPAVQENIYRLKKIGHIVLESPKGELASGLYGNGRLLEPEDIFTRIQHFFNHQLLLKGKKILITAGPTREAIDPVRYISNHSTGKMGYALAEVALQMGAEVTLVSGPVTLKPPAQASVIPVQNAEEMYQHTAHMASLADIIIFAAAVADYTPITPAHQKIKKEDHTFTLQLKKTTDIAAELGKQKKSNQIFVGFALETHNETEHAIQKLKNKHFDFIVLNSLSDEGAGFTYDTNKITIIEKDNTITSYELKDKLSVASDIMLKVAEHIRRKEKNTIV